MPGPRGEPLPRLHVPLIVAVLVLATLLAPSGGDGRGGRTGGAASNAASNAAPSAAHHLLHPAPRRHPERVRGEGSAAPLQARRPGLWTDLLRASREIGPSRSARASVVLVLARRAGDAAVAAWARRRRLGATISAGGLVAVVSGVPRRLGSSFGVRVDDYRAPDGQLFTASASDPAVPTALRGLVVGAGRISSYRQLVEERPGAGVAPAASGPTVGLTPGALLQAYDATPLRRQGIDGAGETVVVIESDGFSAGDLQRFSSRYGLPPFTGSSAVTVVGGQAGPPQGESTMDLETLREIAPRARLVYVNLLHGVTRSTSTTEAFLAAFSLAARRYPGAIWSISLGTCEKLLDFSDLDSLQLAVAGAERAGSTVFAASGDAGGYDCAGWDSTGGAWGAAPSSDAAGVNVPAVLPAVTGVGGTTLSLSRSGAYGGEAAWFYPTTGLGTGGGTSQLIAQPSWQEGSGLPAPSSDVGREVPDVSAVADGISGNAIVEGGRWTVGNGTSLATPVWAGFAALVDEYLRRLHRPALGFANGELYSLARGGARYRAFHTVSAGGNDLHRNGSGYNPTTGLGSPDVWNLARDLAAAGA